MRSVTPALNQPKAPWRRRAGRRLRRWLLSAFWIGAVLVPPTPTVDLLHGLPAAVVYGEAGVIKVLVDASCFQPRPGVSRAGCDPGVFPAPLASISFTSRDGGLTTWAVANLSGRYVVLLPPGRYWARIDTGPAPYFDGVEVTALAGHWLRADLRTGGVSTAD